MRGKQFLISEEQYNQLKYQFDFGVPFKIKELSKTVDEYQNEDVTAFELYSILYTDTIKTAQILVTNTSTAGDSRFETL